MIDRNVAIWLAAILVSGGLVYVLGPVLMPFALAALLAYLGDPLMARLVALHVPRSLAVSLVFAVLIMTLLVLLAFVLPLFEAQFRVLMQRWPDYIVWLQQHILPLLESRLGIDASFDVDMLKNVVNAHWQQVGGVSVAIIETISGSLSVMVAVLGNLVIVPVVTFYLLRDWNRLLVAIRGLFPRHLEPVFVRLLGECHAVLATFMRGQLSVMLVLAAIYALGLWLAGLELGLLIGVLAGALAIVPYLGLIVGMSAALLAGYFQMHDFSLLLPVLIVFGVGQVMESVVLTPWLVGDSIGLHPVAVIFAVMAGGQLFGVVGVLLALPVAAVIVVLLRYLHGRYLESDLYSSENGAESRSELKSGEL